MSSPSNIWLPWQLLRHWRTATYSLSSFLLVHCHHFFPPGYPSTHHLFLQSTTSNPIIQGNSKCAFVCQFLKREGLTSGSLRQKRRSSYALCGGHGELISGQHSLRAVVFKLQITTHKRVVKSTQYIMIHIFFIKKQSRKYHRVLHIVRVLENLNFSFLIVGACVQLCIYINISMHICHTYTLGHATRCTEFGLGISPFSPVCPSTFVQGLNCTNI